MTMLEHSRRIRRNVMVCTHNDENGEVASKLEERSRVCLLQG